MNVTDPTTDLRFPEILELILKIASGDFESRAQLSGAGDDIDAVLLGLNLLAEELSVSWQAAHAASQAKSEFLATMSHELRTPLNAIIGFSELLKTQNLGSLNEDQSRHVQNILTSGHHLLVLINEVLDISKIEAGKVNLNLANVEILPALDSVIARMQPLASKKNIHLSTDIEEDLPPLNADPQRFDQIIYNLLSNAIKFTRDGGRIDLTAAQSGGSRLEIKVEDTGIGIQPENLERVFEAFDQLDSSYAREQEGTGLGLALTRQLVELHGGNILVQSEGKDKGSMFILNLPLSEIENSTK